MEGATWKNIVSKIKCFTALRKCLACIVSFKNWSQTWLMEGWKPSKISSQCLLIYVRKSYSVQSLVQAHWTLFSVHSSTFHHMGVMVYYMVIMFIHKTNDCNNIWRMFVFFNTYHTTKYTLHIYKRENKVFLRL